LVRGSEPAAERVFYGDAMRWRARGMTLRSMLGILFRPCDIIVQAHERRFDMNQVLEAFLTDLDRKKNKGKQVYVELLVLSNILSGNLVEISSDLETITLSDLHRNDKYLNITLTILTENIFGWNAKVSD